MWITGGEPAPFAGYLLDKQAGAYHTARLRLIEGRLELALSELSILNEHTIKAGQALELCTSESKALRAVIDERGEVDERGAVVVWGVAGFGVGLAAGLVVLFVAK